MNSNEYRYIRLLNNAGYKSFGDKFPSIVMARVSKFMVFADVPISENIRINPKSAWRGDEHSFGPMRAQAHLHIGHSSFEILNDDEVRCYELTGKAEPEVNPFAYWNKIKRSPCLF